MNKILKVLTPALLLAAACPAMTLVQTPAWTEAYDAPVYRTVPYQVEHIHHHLFGETRTYETEMRQVLDRYEQRLEIHPEVCTQVDDNGCVTVIPSGNFATYATGRVIRLQAGVRYTGKINSHLVSGDMNDRVIDLGAVAVVPAPVVVVAPAPVIVTPAPVIIRTEEHWDLPIVVGIGVGHRRGYEPHYEPRHDHGRGW